MMNRFLIFFVCMLFLSMTSRSVAVADELTLSLPKWTGILPPDPGYSTLEKLDVDYKIKEFMTSLNQYCPIEIAPNELTLESIERDGLTYKLKFHYWDEFPSMMDLKVFVEYIYSSLSANGFEDISLCIKDALYSYYDVELIVLEDNDPNKQSNVLLRQDGTIDNLLDLPEIKTIEATSLTIMDDEGNVESIIDSDGTIHYYNRTEPEEENQIFIAVEEPAEFPGGNNALLQWLNQNIVYPDDAYQNNITGQVVVKFVIGKDGVIKDVVIVKGVCRSLDMEAIRVIKSMPKWIPAKNNGVAVNSYYNLPITFNLSTNLSD